VGRMGRIGQASAGRERGRDSRLRLIRGHADVDVHAATAGPGTAQALERDVGIASVSIDDVLIRAKAPVPERGGPERTSVATGVLRHVDADHLDLRGVRLDPQPPSLDRDPASQLDIALTQCPVLAGGRADRDSLRPQVDIGEMPDGLGNRGDRRHEPRAVLERAGSEVGVGA